MRLSPRSTRSALLSLSLVGVTVLAPATAARAIGAVPAPGPGFAPGISLFDAAGASTNAAEPSIHVDGQDHVFVSAPAGVPTGGCPFWSVHPDSLNPGGKAYEYRGTIDTDHGSVGGGDCDISSTPVVGGNDSVSVTSLSLGNLTSNVTTDLGVTFGVANTASQQIFGVDREWQTADESLGRHYLSVHDLATSNIQVSVATDGGYQYVQNAPAIDPTKNRKALSSGVSISVVDGSNHFGPTVVDPTTHKLYIPFLAPIEGSTGFKEHAFYIAEGDPCALAACTAGGPVGPISWTSRLAFAAPVTVGLSNDFPVLTMDRNGTLYAAFTGDVGKPASPTGSYDTSRIFVMHGTMPHSASAWSTPQAVDPGTANANIFPWLVAGTAGDVGVAWYSAVVDTTRTTCPGAGAPGNGAGATASVSDNCLNLWNMSYAQSTNGDSSSPSWTVSDASAGLIHRGPICNQGLSCADGTRTLLDFFDVAVDSQGRPNFAYVSDTRVLNTADVKYTRQCAGTSLTGVALAGCVPIGTVPDVCTADAAYTDPPGDATGAFSTETPGPNDPNYDVVGGNVSSTPTDLVLTTRLKDLTASPLGVIVETHFKVAAKEYYVMAQRATPDGVETFVYGDMTGTTGGRKQLGTGTGSFDETTDLVRATIPRAAITGGLPDGTLVTSVVVTTRRDGVLVIPDADSATSACAYTTGAALPEVIVPEVPYVALVPLAALTVLGATVYYRRRRGAAVAA